MNIHTYIHIYIYIYIPTSWFNNFTGWMNTEGGINSLLSGNKQNTAKEYNLFYLTPKFQAKWNLIKEEFITSFHPWTNIYITDSIQNSTRKSDLFREILTVCTQMEDLQGSVLNHCSSCKSWSISEPISVFFCHGHQAHWFAM